MKQLITPWDIIRFWTLSGRQSHIHADECWIAAYQGTIVLRATRQNGRRQNDGVRVGGVALRTGHGTEEHEIVFVFATTNSVGDSGKLLNFNGNWRFPRLFVTMAIKFRPGDRSLCWPLNLITQWIPSPPRFKIPSPGGTLYLTFFPRFLYSFPEKLRCI